MGFSDRHLTALQRVTDRLYATLPRRQPDQQRLGDCRLVAHRGDHDHTPITTPDADHNTVCLENTLAAFHRCQQAGVWGIECDIQWTRDGVPMVIHDSDAGRVFAQPGLVIQRYNKDDIHQMCPLIPTLESVITQCCPTLHLMLEIKQDTWLAEHEAVLFDTLKGLRPGEHYHLLCLDMHLLDQLTLFDPACFIGVALTNTRQVFNHVMASSWAAMSGHYVLLNQAMHHRLKAQGKQVGTGFVASRHALFRELNRGTRWVFSNNAVHLQRDLNAFLKRQR